MNGFPSQRVWRVVQIDAPFDDGGQCADIPDPVEFTDQLFVELQPVGRDLEVGPSAQNPQAIVKRADRAIVCQLDPDDDCDAQRYTGYRQQRSDRVSRHVAKDVAMEE